MFSMYNNSSEGDGRHHQAVVWLRQLIVPTESSCERHQGEVSQGNVRNQQVSQRAMGHMDDGCTSTGAPPDIVLAGNGVL